MERTEEKLAELTSLFDTHLEWLAVRDNGRTMPLIRSEIEVNASGKKVTLGLIDDNGFSVWRVENFTFEDNEIVVEVASAIKNETQTIRFIPRESAATLRANIEYARLVKANEIAQLFIESVPETKLIRISLNVQNGRIAQVEAEDNNRVRVAIAADVTASLTHETLLASVLKWLDELRGRRKDPIRRVVIVAEKRQARNLQKLLALLNKGTAESVSIFEIDRKPSSPEVKELRRLHLSDLWREKPSKLRLPQNVEPSETARKIIEMSPEKIDRIVSKNGETLRFLGIPFARVRRMLGRERAWFGVGKIRRPVGESASRAFKRLRDELSLYRSSTPSNKRHDWFRLSSEAWLESLLKRNIKLLDANLILSPIYNQFRSSNDKIDLLAVRRDGRLVIIEIKTSPDRDTIFQAADYWRKIELQRRKGILAEARLFGENEIADTPALIYIVAPALSFHHDFEYFARTLNPDIELWRWELHENWRSEVKVIGRKRY